MMFGFMLWAALAIGCTLALVFGDAEMKGAVIMLAAFIAIGTTGYLVDKIKKGERQ